MLKAEAKRLNINFNFDQVRWIDTMKSTSDLIPSKKKRPKLQELYTFLFGKPFEGAHDAMADIRATKDCFLQLIKVTNLLDHPLGITEIKLKKQNETKNQTSDFIDPEEENGLDLSKLKTKRSDNKVALKFLDLVEKGEENIFLTGKA
jgi:DNA polymerase III, alpha subunit